MLHTTLVPIDLESSGEFIFIRYHDFCNMGGERLTLQVEQTIRTLSKEGNSYSVIVKKLKAEGLDVGKATICRVVNGIGKKREAESNGQKFQVDRPRPVRTPATVSKVKRLATTENPPSQRQLSRMCGTSLKTINNIIHKDLELDTRRKGKVHKLTPFHMKNRATNARKLYEEHLAGSRSEYTATLDEAWMYVTYCNGIRKICYIKRGNQVPDNWVHQCSETFPKGFMVVGVMTGRGVLPLIKVPSKVKVNSEFYIECVLKPVIEQLKDLYPGEMDKVFLHHDKASSHTSNKTQQFLQEMKDTLGLNFIRNSDIPVKPPDASPLDFYGFGMLKQRLFNRRPKTEAGLWKAAQEEWSNVSLSKVKEVFAAWKVRCREIAKKKGKHIEHMKKIHEEWTLTKDLLMLSTWRIVSFHTTGQPRLDGTVGPRFHRRVKAKTSLQDDDVPLDDTTTKPLFTPQEKGRKAMAAALQKIDMDPEQQLYTPKIEEIATAALGPCQFSVVLYLNDQKTGPSGILKNHEMVLAKSLNSYNCVPKCGHDVKYTAEHKVFTSLWMGVFSSVSFMATLLTVLTFCIDAARFRFPEKPIVFLNICLFFCSLAYIIRVFGGPEFISCKNSENGEDYLTHEGLESSGCIVVFLLLYYFGIAALAWWVILAVTWYLAAGKQWSHEAIDARASYFHFLAWGLPSGLTITVLILRYVDADELTGMCFIGNHDSYALLSFVIIPMFILIILGIIFMIVGFLQYEMAASDMRNRHHVQPLLTWSTDSSCIPVVLTGYYQPGQLSPAKVEFRL
ncbi:FZD9 [Cordylochernes scorpioides]|uniref:FZD9 n=1 Tax=Cordylochernes scorpioides TaxID=51811 RepID=A0ABY6K721_9ARAC|nr:FZD9 [Cordylochernes scorpioides]